MKSRFRSTGRLMPLGLALATTLAAGAAPVVTRLNPPSLLFESGDAEPPIIARFLPGQRFDLQATIQADPGTTIESAAFRIAGAPAAGNVTITPIGSDRFSVTLRAFSHSVPGIHTFSVTASQQGGGTVTATGNLEIVGVSGNAGRKAKNVIWMIGDGMGVAHRTAARLVSRGSSLGKARGRLAMDTMTHTAMVMTASLNSIITDSAPGAACYATGNKCNNNQEGVFPDDTADKWDNPRVENMGTYLARTQGKALGIVTTADVEDATPAAFGTHTQDRAAGTGICDMFLDQAVAHSNLRVLMGGGRKWFLPAGTTGSGRVGSATAAGADYVLPADTAAAWGVPAGAVDPERDLIAGFQAAGFTYAPDATTLHGIPPETDRLLGLFNTGNMDVSFDKINARRGGAVSGTVGTFPDQPMLDGMTRQALQVLSRNEQGFVLLVEGASIDKQSHNMDAERFILETIEFDRSVAVVLEFLAAHPDTLVIVTADHECAGVNVIGGSRLTNAAHIEASHGGGVAGLRDNLVGTYDQAGFPKYPLLKDGFPSTMDIDYKMVVGYAASPDRYEDWLANPAANAGPKERDADGKFMVTGQVPGPNAVHTGTDIQLSAAGHGASLFHGVMDNTEPFFKAMQVLIGGLE